MRNLKDESTVIDSKGNVPNSVPMLGNMAVHNLLSGVEGTLKDEKYFVEFHHMASRFTMVGLQAAISNSLQSEAGAIVGGSLSSITHPEHYMVKAMIFAALSHSQASISLVS